MRLVNNCSLVFLSTTADNSWVIVLCSSNSINIPGQGNFFQHSCLNIRQKNRSRTCLTYHQSAVMCWWCDSIAIDSKNTRAAVSSAHVVYVARWRWRISQWRRADAKKPRSASSLVSFFWCRYTFFSVFHLSLSAAHTLYTFFFVCRNENARSGENTSDIPKQQLSTQGGGEEGKKKCIYIFFITHSLQVEMLSARESDIPTESTTEKSRERERRTLPLHWKTKTQLSRCRARSSRCVNQLVVCCVSFKSWFGFFFDYVMMMHDDDCVPLGSTVLLLHHLLKALESWTHPHGADDGSTRVCTWAIASAELVSRPWLCCTSVTRAYVDIAQNFRWWHCDSSAQLSHNIWNIFVSHMSSPPVLPDTLRCWIYMRLIQ